MLKDLKLGDDVQEANDVIGGSGALDTGIYPFKLKVAYLGKAKSNAVSVTVVGVIKDGSPDGREFRTTQWIVSGDKKGNKPYYERGGKKFPLPGYSVIDDLCTLATGKGLSEAETEDKSVKIYDFDEQKDVATEVEALADMQGEDFYLVIQKVLEDKTEDDGAGGRSPTGDTREINEVVKVLCADTHATVTEITKETEIVYAEKWLAKNEGKVRDKTSKTGAKAGAPKKAAKKAMFA